MHESAVQVETQTISLYPEQKNILVQVARDLGMASISATVRFIITDWVNLKRAAIATAQPADERN